jgi:23S rRNA pseudouridine955/2504/2580 synthase
MTASETARRVEHWEAEEGDAGQRIDNFLMRRLKGVPRSVIYRILRRGEVRVNARRIGPDYRLVAGDQVRVPPVRAAAERPVPQPGAGLAATLAASILYEDDRLLVVNKPAGLAVHGGSGVSYGVIEALRALRPGERELELVHRLDRDTSGCLMLAKRRSLLRLLHGLQRDDRIEKRYLALLAGRWRRGAARVDAPLRKSVLHGGERMVKVAADGKEAVTELRVVQRFTDSTLVEAVLVTGRTHQIRVHAAHLGTPILGDAKYGDPEANRHYRQLGLRRLFLHAATLVIRWPGDEPPLRVDAPLDPELSRFLATLEAA